MKALPLLLVSAALAVAAEPEPWPQANGPFGNFNPRQYGHALVDDLKDARVAWTSADAWLGFCKGSSSGYVRHLADSSTHPGTGSGLIVAEGKVFASSFRPRGAVWPEHHPGIGGSFKSGQWSAEQTAAIQRNSAYDADDLTVALDLQTGKTLWSAVEESRGVNRYSGKRLHFMATPAYHAGRVFSLGTMGVLFCYDAATGKKLWEDATGSLAREMPAVKEKLLRDRKEMAGGGGMGVSLVVADGVLVVPEFDLKGARDIGLRGVDVASGRTLWVLPAATCRYATPAVWTHQGRQFLLCATVGQPNKFDTGTLRLLDPKTGKVLWTVTGLAPTYYSLSPSATHVCVNVPSAVPNSKKSKTEEPWGLVAAFRLTHEKAERAWTMPDQPPFWFENHMDICAMRRVVVRDGRVYFFSQGHTLAPEQASFFFHILREDTGAVLYSSKEKDFAHASVANPGNSILGQFWLVEDRLLNMPDGAHSDRSTMQWVTTDPQEVRRLGTRWKPPHENTTAYEVFIELPYVDGRFLMRSGDGRVRCYDLRTTAAAVGNRKP